MSNNLKRYEIRTKMSAEKAKAKYKALADSIKAVTSMISQITRDVPDETKLAITSRLMELTIPKVKPQEIDSARWYEMNQMYKLLNANIGARNNRINAGAFNQVIPLGKGDLVNLLGILGGVK